ncbi:MAG: hypothetical protein RLZZ210_288 [Pseudomonadota bacterium]
MHNAIQNIQTQVLARKWRPQTFAQTIGQDVVVKALSNALDTNRLHHAYLFTGTRGVGKTTLSRLLAKALSCEQGISSNPCGVCSNCVSIQNAQYIDYIELDAASNRGVEEISKLLENASYQPSQGRFKIFMIDEVHMLSNHAFNAMLKTLEEPPAHVKFILATTDAHKIPMTVLSRCLQFHLRPVSTVNITQYLQYILQQENVNFEEIALNYIAKAAYGSMRDALSITDQAIALGHGQIKAYETKQMLGLVDDDLTINLLFSIANSDIVNALSLIENVQNIDKFLDNVIVHLQNIAIIQCLETAVIDTNYHDEVKELAKLISAENVQIYYQMVIKTKQEINFCPAEISLNMLCVRMINFQMQIDDSKAININNNPNKTNQLKSTTSITNKFNHHHKPNIIQSNSFDNNLPEKVIHSTNNINKLPQNQNEALKIIDKVDEITNISSKNSNHIEPISDNLLNNTINDKYNIINHKQEPEILLENIEPNINHQATNQINNQNWLDIIPQLKLEGLALQIAKQSVLAKDDGNNLHLNCEFDTGFMKNAVAKLQTSISEYLNRNINLHISSGSGITKVVSNPSISTTRVNPKAPEVINSNVSTSNLNLPVQSNLSSISNINVDDSVSVDVISNQNNSSDNKDLNLDLDSITLFQKEQNEKQKHTQTQLEKAQQDPWVNEFTKINAEIII